MRYLAITLIIPILIVASCAHGGPGYCGGVTEYDMMPCPSDSDASPDALAPTPDASVPLF